MRRQTTVLTPASTLVVPQRPLGATAPRRRTACPPTLPAAAYRSLTTRCRAPPARQQSLRLRGRPRRAARARRLVQCTRPMALWQRRRRSPSDCRRPCWHCTRTRAYSTRSPATVFHVPLFVPDGQRRFGTHTFTHPPTHPQLIQSLTHSFVRHPRIHPPFTLFSIKQQAVP